ncbi:hypothetical protein GGR52DRAFT_564936 [Hypoxylon sp. FL1284]|nr:hypothetical protein GGR52DRAFT_564936 [Hypoxylon sp. FL1284]
MAKNKRRGAGSRFKGQRFPRRHGGPSGNQFGEHGGKPTLPTAHGYTLAEEARNTASNRRGAVGRDAKLRYHPVPFISAGFIEPLKDLDTQLTTTEEVQATTEEVQGNTAALGRPSANVTSTSTAASSPKHHARSSNHAASPPALLTLDQPETSVAASPEHFSEPVSNDGYDSTEEVILFKGRDRRRQDPVSSLQSDQGHTDADSLEFPELHRELRAVEETIPRDTATSDAMVEPNDFISFKSKPKGRSRRRASRRNDASDEDEAIIADYMANIELLKEGEDEDGDKSEDLGIGSHAFSVLRDLGGTDSDAVPDGISSDEGLDDGSDSEDEPDSEAQRQQVEANDERMARMLAKQEELGLGSDDVLLFDGEGLDYQWSAAPNATSRRKRKGDAKRAKIVQKKGQYPSATKMADAFDELDLMDWHRPSLNNVKRGLPAFNVSDSELEDVMRSTWQKDRLKKADKKKAREELRSQGLLGKNVNPDDLRTKYLGGMSLDDLANELEAFLLSSREQLVLPPFDKNTRKTIHALANKLKIKSQSAGKGTDRNPVLYRTKATLPFDQTTFDKTFGRIRQTWFPRVDADGEVVSKARILKRAEAQSGKSRFKHSLTYRDGDVVGQHAAELGVENKGRAMLEKMGWSKGMALGSGENKGIMVPITHVVKKTKAGLGDA